VGTNDERMKEKQKLEEDLGFCESRLKELKGKEVGDSFDKELGEIESELASCKVELDELEGRSGDEWLDAKHNITSRLEDTKRSLQLTSKKMIDFIR